MEHTAKPRIIFFGSSAFSAIILEELIKNGMAPVAIVTTPDKPAGRGHALTAPPPKELTIREQIPFLQPARLKDEIFLEDLRRIGGTLFVIASYGKILPSMLLEIPPQGTINVHPSLLPHHRGPSPLQTAILEGDEIFGLTLMLTDAEMDHGPIIANKELGIRNNERIYYQELHDALAKLGGTLLVETLPRWLGGEITPQEQNHSKATFTKMITKEDGKIDWSKTAEAIDCLVRAFEVWPGAWTIWNKNGEELRLKIIAGQASEEKSTENPGTIVKTKNGECAVSTKDNLFVIETIQLPGKNSMSGEDFLNGYSQILGTDIS